MIPFIKKILSITLCFVVFNASFVFANDHVGFIENKGQWDKIIFAKTPVPSGFLYLTDRGFTWQMFDQIKLESIHHHEAENDWVDAYAFKMLWKEGYVKNIEYLKPQPYYHNYFIGKNPAKWQSNVRSFREVIMHNIYAGVDCKIFNNDKGLKYEYYLKAGVDPEIIKQMYVGVSPELDGDGNLLLKTPFQTIIELKPIAYQWVNGIQVMVPCEFVVEGNTVSYSVKNYDHALPLVIDPLLIFSTYSGSYADNWGYTATFDDAGHAYGAGTVFGPGYPTSVGAYQLSYAGNTDIGVSKFSGNNGTLIYSTYLGGSNMDSPHSIVANNQGELYILGTTSSLDYPVISNAYDTSFNGGTPYLLFIGYINYSNGSDIIISRLNSQGTNLLSSTYIGGSLNDGLNYANQLKYNYGDQFRGEIILDNSGYVYVASCTFSSDFPVTIQAYDTTQNGGQDAVVFKMSPDLSQLVWSTFIGGAGDDAAYGLQLSNSGELYVAGGTKSFDFPVTSQAIDTTFNGEVDGFVCRLANNGSQLLSSTFLGSSQYDQGFFVDLDIDGNAYVVGQTKGSYLFYPSNLWGNPNGGQFIHKLTPGLDSTIFSLRFGSGINQTNITLSAFLVSECGYIYVSGWGGAINAGTGSSTNNLPVTPNAYKSTTDGSDFYILVLSNDGKNLLFATFFGANGSAEHCDGGTSRFDKRGKIYQAVCAGCGGSSSFPTTPGAWSNTNNSTNCNLAVFKLDVEPLKATIASSVPGHLCYPPATVTFVNQSTGGNYYTWHFGDGNISHQTMPTYSYQDTGTYEVTLIVQDTNCLAADTAKLTIRVDPVPQAIIDPVYQMCFGDTIQLSAGGGDHYKWFPSNYISNDTIKNPLVYPPANQKYFLIASNQCGSDTAEVYILVHQDSTGIIPDTSLCKGQSIQLYASGGVSYFWHSNQPVQNPNSQSPVVSPSHSDTFYVTITDVNGCEWQKKVFVRVDTNFVKLVLPNDTVVCSDSSFVWVVSGADHYLWLPSIYLSSNNNDTVTVTPSSTTTYMVYGFNACSVDSGKVTVFVSNPMPAIDDSIYVCKSSYAQFDAGIVGQTYQWEPPGYFLNPNAPSTVGYFENPAEISITVTDSLGCRSTKNVMVNLHPLPNIETPDIMVEYLSSATLHAQVKNDVVDFSWIVPSGQPHLSCLKCLNPTTPQLTENVFYLFYAKNNYECEVIDTVNVYVGGIIFLPNAFTPDNDGKNDVYFAKGYNIENFEMNIFDRWGNLVFKSNDIMQGWDGTINGQPAPMGVYQVTVFYTDTGKKQGQIIEKALLIR
ncbi:MAG: hypothetical protein KatS3mg034_1296 [Vicingaceae bacterium]|nr:MAG: hypothetical protein KatS3mg034_1296 [Vicingaceae bacterium]